MSERTVRDGQAWPIREFELDGPRLRALAQRFLGSAEAADAALRTARERLDRETGLDLWLTTEVGRACVRRLRARSAEPGGPGTGPGAGPGSGPGCASRSDTAAAAGPEPGAGGDSFVLALFVVLETLPAPERLAFLLHHLFAVALDDVAVTLGRTPAATYALVADARRRLRGGAPGPR
ncbi:hypothetical protein ACQB60_21205 [Actinomycetota bacterium Odt1-20B]